MVATMKTQSKNLQTKFSQICDIIPARNLSITRAQCCHSILISFLLSSSSWRLARILITALLPSLPPSLPMVDVQSCSDPVRHPAQTALHHAHRHYDLASGGKYFLRKYFD